MTRLLALDTATEACSAALLVGDALLERYQLAPRGHADLLLPMVESLLTEAGIALRELDAIAFDRGPGSFTGVRIGASVVQGLAFAADLPVVPVSSLAALAQQACRDGDEYLVLAAIDARMDEVYWGQFRCVDGLATAVGDECVIAPEGVILENPAPWIGIGSGWSSYRDRLESALGRPLAGCTPDRYPAAREVALLAARAARDGRGVAPELALPVYLRDRVAEMPG